jgi:hypothetical protein
MMKSRVFVRGVVLLLAVFWMTACSGNAPAQAAEAWFQATATSDGATALKLTCEAYREEMQNLSLFMGGFNLLSGGLLSEAGADLSGLEFSVVSRQGDEAVVKIEGEIIQSVLGAAMAQPVNANVLMVKEDGEWRWCGEQ